MGAVCPLSIYRLYTFVDQLPGCHFQKPIICSIIQTLQLDTPKIGMVISAEFGTFGQVLGGHHGGKRQIFHRF
jgi:hypothetical protein